MSPEQPIPADEQLSVAFGPTHWQLLGPDDAPVLEVRAKMIYYHPAFGRWRDLPPGDQMGVDGIESVQVRWDGGWAVGFVMMPGLFRRLVRWSDSRKLAQADDAARVLSELTGLPLRTEDDDVPVVTRVGRESSSLKAAIPPASMEPPRFAPPKPTIDAEPVVTRQRPATRTVAAPVVSVAQVYTVNDASDVRLPLRLGNGAQLRKDDDECLVLTMPIPSRTGAFTIWMVGLLTLVVFIAVIIAVQQQFMGGNPFAGLAIAGGGLVIVGLLGVLILARVSRQMEKRVIFDRYGESITFEPGLDGKKRDVIDMAIVNGIRIRGNAAKNRSKLAYQRTVHVLLDDGDRQVFEEIRETSLPPDPAVMPSLAALRRQADEKAGPSLARAGARVIAWYLQVPLADE